MGDWKDPRNDERGRRVRNLSLAHIPRKLIRKISTIRRWKFVELMDKEDYERTGATKIPHGWWWAPAGRSEDLKNERSSNI